MDFIMGNKPPLLSTQVYPHDCPQLLVSFTAKVLMTVELNSSCCRDIVDGGRLSPVPVCQPNTWMLG